MIFRPELVNLILRGQKTETRRPVKSGETECRYKVGRTYAVQPGRTKAGVARIRILSARKERLGLVTDEDAEREGFTARNDLTPRQEFLNYWLVLYGRLDEDQEVWVIRFKLVG